MKNLIINSKKDKEVIDITEQIEDLFTNETGIINIFTKHTTAALTTADLDPGTDMDYIKVLDFLKRIIPNLNFNHPHDPSHFPDHFLSSIIGTSITLPIKNGEIILGIWQRIILIELNGPKSRDIIITFLKS